MKTLVLCIDRDDDIGVKTGIKGPIVGREDNVRVANRLALADPEDADLNTLFSSIKIFDKLVTSGMDTEVATICGDKNVGHESDRILTEQLDEVLDEIRPHNVYLVTDGAEDEYIFPIVSSRIKVNHVKRVFVKQSPTLESGFYLIIKVLKDQMMRKKIFTLPTIILLIYGILGFLLPFMLNITWGTFDLNTIPNYALPIISLAIGLYFLHLAYPVSFSIKNLYRRIARFYINTKESMVSGDVSFVFSIIAVILVIIGLFIGFDTALKEAKSEIDGIFFFIGGAFLWVVLGILTHEGGKVARAYQKGIVIRPSFWVVTISLFVALIVFSLLLLVAFNLFGYLLNIESAETVLTLTFFEIAISLIVIIAGGILYRSMQEKILI